MVSVVCVNAKSNWQRYIKTHKSEFDTGSNVTRRLVVGRKGFGVHSMNKQSQYL
jgi:hypothetical protein